MKIKKILYGGDYNPEQWKRFPDILKEDIRLMKKAKCNTMTIGVFNWSEIEKEEDKFDFSFMDSVIENIKSIGGNIILATPTAGVPRWLSNKSDDVLKTDENGNKIRYGRMNFCYSSPLFRERVKKINTELCYHYKNNDGIIMWHISNEFDTPCYCKRCVAKFHNWLKNKYKTIENLNAEWCTSFWSNTFNSWEEISPIGDVSVHGIYLDWKRFTTELIGEYLKFERDILKKETPDIPITTNYMVLYDKINYNKWNDIVDVVSVDSYPKWHINDDVNTAVRTAFAFDNFRSMKKQPFILMESATSCTSTQTPTCKNKKPGMNILASLQAVSHGSDSVMFFQWRKSRGGQEKFHGAVVGHDGTENTRVFKEVRELGIILDKISPIVSSESKSEVAVIYDIENKWSLDVLWGLQNGPKKYEETCINHYRQFWNKGINVDVINCEKDFSDYKIIIAPMLHMITEEVAKKIELYVKNGGIFIGTYVMGYVNENNLCYLGGYPCGILKDVFGIEIYETEALLENEYNTVNGYKAIDYCDIINLKTAEKLGIYEQDFYAGTPAVTKNIYGNGTAYYIGFRDTGEFLEDFYDKLIKECNINTEFDNLPYGVTARTRFKEDKEYAIIQNYNSYSAEVNLKKQYLNMLDGNLISGKKELPTYGVLILEKERENF